MSDDSSAKPAENLREAALQLRTDENALKLARLRSDLSSEAGSESNASSPHFYSSSVRHDDPSLDSYISTTYTPHDHRADSSEAHNIVLPSANSASERQLEEQGVKLDLLRRAHSQRAKETLDQLQHAASGASSHGHESSAQSIDSNISISTDTVRQRSQQLRQVSGDLKRFAVEQRTSAEDAVANYLLQVVHRQLGRHTVAFLFGSSSHTVTQALLHQPGASMHILRCRRTSSQMTQVVGYQNTAETLGQAPEVLQPVTETLG